MIFSQLPNFSNYNVAGSVDCSVLFSCYLQKQIYEKANRDIQSGGYLQETIVVFDAKHKKISSKMRSKMQEKNSWLVDQVDMIFRSSMSNRRVLSISPWFLNTKSRAR